MSKQKQVLGSSLWDTLPDDMFYEILGYIKTKEAILKALQVCKRWHKNTMKLKFNWAAFSIDAQQHEKKALTALAERHTEMDFGAMTDELLKTWKGCPNNVRQGFAEMEKAIKFYDLAKNKDKTEELALVLKSHPYFAGAGSPYLQGRVGRILQEKGPDTSTIVLKGLGLVLLLLAIAYVLYLMMNDTLPVPKQTGKNRHGL